MEGFSFPAKTITGTKQGVKEGFAVETERMSKSAYSDCRR